MKEITPKGIRRSRAGKAQPWNSIIQFYRSHSSLEPMLRLVQALATSPVANELFPNTSMLTLIIGDEEERYFNDNLLFIKYKAGSHTFIFEHRTLSGKNDKKICTESEALETLRLFLKYKFAVLLNPSVKDRTSFAH